MFCVIFQFAVVYKSRHNTGIIKKSVITWIAEAVNKGTTYSHKVNLDSPDLVILVEIIKVSRVHVITCSWCDLYKVAN